MVKVLCDAPDSLAKGIDFALLHNPGLGAGHDASGCPARERASLEDETRRDQRARGGHAAGDDIAGNDMGSVGVRVTKEISEGDDGPGIAT